MASRLRDRLALLALVVAFATAQAGCESHSSVHLLSIKLNLLPWVSENRTITADEAGDAFVLAAEHKGRMPVLLYNGSVWTGRPLPAVSHHYTLHIDELVDVAASHPDLAVELLLNFVDNPVASNVRAPSVPFWSINWVQGAVDFAMPWYVRHTSRASLDSP